MEEKSRLKKSDRVRFTLFIVIHIVLCLSAFLCVWGLEQFVALDSMDASLGIIFALGFILEVVLVLFIQLLCPMVMLVEAAFLVIVLRFTAVKKDTRVTGYELKATLAVMLVGVALTWVVGVIFNGLGAVLMMGTMFFSVLILELAMYWIALWEGQKKSTHLSSQCIYYDN
ncbi:MAG: hypothetical protein NC092_03560 [Butyrivibrio sp.]|nr:hypothetical protein [Muribaculum sp.]MCM1551750.1 hypothetical protein [Butyrivibrio sp.]